MIKLDYLGTSSKRETYKRKRKYKVWKLRFNENINRENKDNKKISSTNNSMSTNLSNDILIMDLLLILMFISFICFIKIWKLTFCGS